MIPAPKQKKKIVSALIPDLPLVFYGVFYLFTLVFAIAFFKIVEQSLPLTLEIIGS